MLAVAPSPVTSYQRMPAVPPAATVCDSQSEPPRNWALFITRGLKLSTASPGVGMSPTEEYDTDRLPVRLNTLFAAFAQSTWNFHRLILPLQIEAMYFRTGGRRRVDRVRRHQAEVRRA